MFCSNCGKTLPQDAASCPFCNAAVGESRFEGSPYTSAQPHILPGDDVRGIILNNYTRTTYTRTPDAAEEGETDTRTTYRPNYNGDYIPEEVRRDFDAELSPQPAQPEQPVDAPEEEEDTEPLDIPVPEELSPETASSLKALNDELQMDDLDLSRFKAKPIESSGQSGISDSVSEMIEQLDMKAEKAAADKAEKVEKAAASAAARAEKKQEFGAYDTDVSTAGEGEPTVTETDSADKSLSDVDEFDEIATSSFGPSQLIKAAVAVLLVAALVVGGVLWMRYVRRNTSASPIENVREELYTQGVEMIRSHASTENEQQVLSAFSAAGNDLTALSTSLSTASTEITALLPEEPTENEQLFVRALTQIQRNINNCVTADAMELSASQSVDAAASEERWSVVNNSITMLQNATSASELTAIINGEVVDVAQLQATPSPTPSVNYNTLSKGDKSEAVATMQQRLIDLGYLSDVADGAFGTKTQTAVKIFQQVAGLPVTGVADGTTLNALYADDAPTSTEAAQSAPTPAPESADTQTGTEAGTEAAGEPASETGEAADEAADTAA